MIADAATEANAVAGAYTGANADARAGALPWGQAPLLDVSCGLDGAGGPRLLAGGRPARGHTSDRALALSVVGALSSLLAAICPLTPSPTN